MTCKIRSPCRILGISSLKLHDAQHPRNPLGTSILSSMVHNILEISSNQSSAVHTILYNKSVQNVVIHYIFSSESLRVVNSLQIVNSLQVLFLVCQGPLGPSPRPTPTPPNTPKWTRNGPETDRNGPKRTRNGPKSSSLVFRVGRRGGLSGWGVGWGL